MIEVEKLTKSYGPFQAVKGISFEVGKAEVVGFLGPNGAGKSTTLRILAGYLGMTSGRVRIAGHDILDDSAAARAAIGYMPEGAPLYQEMRVEEYLRFRVELKGVPRKDRLTSVERAMRDTHLDDMADVVIGNLSKGYKQRVALADALVARPPILIFDEPTAHLDPNQIRDVRTLIRELGEKHTVLLSTHILPEVESVCSRAFVIARGKLVAQGSIDSLRSTRRSTHARVVVRAPVSNPEPNDALIKGVEALPRCPRSSA
ncbi:MAG: ABC transporter ATP-binding protein [Polyangiaceae bacterium]